MANFSLLAPETIFSVTSIDDKLNYPASNLCIQSAGYKWISQTKSAVETDPHTHRIDIDYQGTKNITHVFLGYTNANALTSWNITLDSVSTGSINFWGGNDFSGWGKVHGYHKLDSPISGPFTGSIEIEHVGDFESSYLILSSGWQPDSSDADERYYCVDFGGSIHYKESAPEIETKGATYWGCGNKKRVGKFGFSLGHETPAFRDSLPFMYDGAYTTNIVLRINPDRDEHRMDEIIVGLLKTSEYTYNNYRHFSHNFTVEETQFPSRS